MTTWRIEQVTTPDQIEAIMSIEAVSFTNPWTRDMHQAELDNRGVSYSYVAKDESGAVVGFCSFWRILDELHINNLAVVPERRREGIATTLLTFVLREGAALGATRAMLEVRRSNEAAQRLYERLGFAVTNVRHAYYTKPVEDALVLWRERLEPV